MAVRDELTSRLRDAMRARDRSVAAALRSTLGELANAEAVPAPNVASSTLVSEHVAGAVSGLGAAEAARRELGEDEQRAIVERQRDELLDHAGRLAVLCRHDEADGVRRAAALLDEVLASP